MKTIFSLKNMLTLSTLVLFNITSFAGIIPEKKRIIFREKDKQQILMIANTNDYPILMQTWVDNGNINNIPSSTLSPFIITPPMANLAAGEIKGLRIINKMPKGLPSDRESAFWINLYEVPPVTNDQKLTDNVTVAMNTQIKLFFRPKRLENKPDEKSLVTQLTCQAKRNSSNISIHCQNPTPYYVSLSNITLQDTFQNETQLDMMIPPFGNNSYRVKADINSFLKKLDIQYSFIDDNGDVHGLNTQIDIN